MGKKLLVIEDNETNRRLVRRYAEHWGLAVDTAADSQEGLLRLNEAGPFDAALIDLELPATDGFAVAARIRGELSGRYLPLLLLSSVRLRGDDMRPLHAGIAGVVYKPIRATQLLDGLCRALSVHMQFEKKRPAAPTLDTKLAERLPLRLLLADDNPINQKVVLSVLRKLGYHADVANNGVEVLKALEAKAYDVLFLDVQMPEMDGLEAARQICQRWPYDKRPRMIAMTGNALTGDREKCLEAGMDHYIPKPVRVSDLQATLEEWGPRSTRKSDTAFLWRHKVPRPDEILDHSVLAELRQIQAAGEASMLRELVDLFVHNATIHIKALQDNTEDASKLTFHAHALRSMCLNLGARRIAELTKVLEGLTADGNLKEVPALVAEIAKAFGQTKEHLLPLRDA